MSDVLPYLKLTHAGVQKILAAALAKAEAMNVPQNIAIADDGGHLVGFLRMDGAKKLSGLSAQAKARTSATTRAPTGGAAADIELKLSLAQDLQYTNLRGGLPIVVDGHCVGGIGVGSGTGEQDLDVARAGLAALPGAQKF